MSYAYLNHSDVDVQLFIDSDVQMLTAFQIEPGFS